MLERFAINSCKACKDVFKILKNASNRAWSGEEQWRGAAGPGLKLSVSVKSGLSLPLHCTASWQLVPTHLPPAPSLLEAGGKPFNGQHLMSVLGEYAWHVNVWLWLENCWRKTSHECYSRYSHVLMVSWSVTLIIIVDADLHPCPFIEKGHFWSSKWRSQFCGRGQGMRAQDDTNNNTFRPEQSISVISPHHF